VSGPLFPYWRHRRPTRNFGDALTDLYRLRLLAAPSPADRGVYFLVGSVLDEAWLRRGLRFARERGGAAHYWTCGWRGSPVPDALLGAARVSAVRGPVTRRQLGLPADMPVGDSALLLPLLHDPPATAIRHRRLLVPHFNDPRRERMLRRPRDWGADAVASAEVDGIAAILAVVDAVARSRMVLAGAMHAAVAAAAYGVPFAFFADGFVDCPPKWDDLAASFGTTAVFTDGREGGPAALAAVPPPLRPLLDACPLAVRPEVLRRAAAG
jgi:hypothetical protein